MDPSVGRGRRLRLVAVAGIAAAIGGLAASRFSGGPLPAQQAATRDVTSTSTSAAIAAGVELPDVPEAVSPRDLGGIRFTDVTEFAGLDSPQSNQQLMGEESMTSGAAVADFDGDGDPDIYLTRVGLPNALYRNNGDATFSDIAAAAGVTGLDVEQGSSAAAFADVNADGCLDLYVTANGAGADALYMNDCAGAFRDERAERGIDLQPTDVDLGAQAHGVTFSDFDRDGDLDLFLAHWDTAIMGGEAAQRASEAGRTTGNQCDAIAAIRDEGADRRVAGGPNRSRLYRNDGAGYFTDATNDLGLVLDQVAAFTAQFSDLDDDGWDDLLIAGDFCTSRIFRNNAGQGFIDITARAGVGTDENAMGSVVRDVNGDGSPDWFITSIRCRVPYANTGCSGNRLYLNKGDATFEDATDDYGVRHGWWGWGAAIEDFGNDGRLQFVQANGYFQLDQAPAFTTDPLRFWVRPGSDGPYVEAAAAVGLTNSAVGHALIPLDHDSDGDLDLLVANLAAPPNLYRNDQPGDRSWLTVRLDDPTTPGNRAGIGARVVVDPGGAAPVTTGWINTSGSYESQKPAELHVGLGSRRQPVESIEVWWPGTEEPQRVTSTRVNQVLVITRR